MELISFILAIIVVIDINMSQKRRERNMEKKREELLAKLDHLTRQSSS